MQKQKLEIISAQDTLKNLQSSFTVMQIVPRDCVKSLNKLYYNFQRQDFSSTLLKEIIILLLRGFTSKDKYLKSLIYAILEEMSMKGKDGILCINCILKDIEDKSMSSYTRNFALRTLFTNIPDNLKYDFEQYVQTALMDDSSKDNAICIAAEYFKTLKIKSRLVNTIEDYHLSFFNNLPINKYSSMLEIRRSYAGNKKPANLLQYLNSSVEPIIFFEAAKALTVIRQELAAPMIEKTISVLRVYLSKSPVEIFSAIKILNKLSVDFPNKVVKVNREIEDLVQSSSKTISMMAILTLLRTGTDATVKRLVSKIEPLMHTISDSYKIMAINAMETISKESKAEYISFLKNALIEKGDLKFKKFILKKLVKFLENEEYTSDIIKFLCTYTEDPDFYQLNMEIMGIFGSYLDDSKDLIHIYNRLILDNVHVRSCVYQSLFNLDSKFDTIKHFTEYGDSETLKIRSFLIQNQKLPKGDFNISELGDLKDEVLKYLNVDLLAEEEDVKVEEEDFIKECRNIQLSSDNTDFYVSVTKKMFKSKVVLSFEIDNNMPKIIVNSGELIFNVCRHNSDSVIKEFKIEINEADFGSSNKLVKEITLDNIQIGDVFNGLFTYEISYEDDFEDAETDSIILTAFDINILDYVRPINVPVNPERCVTKELKFKSSPSEAISKIVSATNMLLFVDKDAFDLQGTYDSIPLVIKGGIKETKYTKVSMDIFCDNDGLIEKVLDVFD